MHELLEVWTDRKGIANIAMTGLLYALLLIPFNQLHWTIAGISIRPAAMLPIFSGIIFGPAAAWGLAIGNIAGDFFGSWSMMSVFGFLVNFLMPYLSYLVWHRLMEGHEFRVNRTSVGYYLLVSFTITTVCMFLLACSGTIFFGRPFESKFISYLGNNIIWSMTAGTALFGLALEPAIRWRLVYGKKWVKMGMTVGM